jgi:DNA-binding NtrC family response regulator
MSARPVLVIEDHADTRRMVEEYLRFEGFAAIGARTAETGCRHCANIAFAHPVGSLHARDGWVAVPERTARMTEQHLAAVPVVVLSALKDCARQAEILGAVDVIPKLIDFDRLLVVVRQYCQARH